MTTVRILPSLEARDKHDGGDLGGEHLPNLCNSLHLWGDSRVHVVVGGEGFEILVVAVAAFAPNSLLARLGTDYDIRNQWFFAILEATTPD